MRENGVAVFGQARATAQHVTWNTCGRHKPTLPLHDCKRVSHRPAYTPEHKSTWDYRYTNTFDTHMDPSCSLHKATKSILYWSGTLKTVVQKKKHPKVWNHGVVVFAPARVSTGGGGGVT